MRILAYELRTGMVIPDGIASTVTLGEPFETIGKFHVAFRSKTQRNRIMVWPRLAVVKIQTEADAEADAEAIAEAAAMLGRVIAVHNIATILGIGRR